MTSDNPLFSKYFLLLLAVFVVSFLFFNFITDSLGLFFPHYDEFGDLSNGFDAINAIPSIVICYFLEGIIAVKLKEEPEEYSKRRYVKEALIFLCLYFAAIVIFMLMQSLDFSIRLSGLLSTIPLWIYGFILYCRHLLKINTKK
ncbi:hypothetical protein LJC46_09865 [Desulfovibrio sp. OttesenSCG-928-G15]|nr:hypothetical protein [Desulfovibrio sp. OttesenSCG-928-G15]